MAKTGRNDPCPCGSGKKYKKCCMGKDSSSATTPKVVTSGGEEVVFFEAHYELTNRAEAVKRLGAAEDFALESSGHITPRTKSANFAWLERGESAGVSGGRPAKLPDILGNTSGTRLLGNIDLRPERFIFHAVGQNRFEAGKRRLESILSGLIRHRLDSIQSLESAAIEDKTPLPHYGSGPSGALPTITPDDRRFAPLADGETLQEAMERRGFKSLEEVNLFTDQVMEDYNNRPQVEMAGLSPIQVGRLIYGDWEDEDGVLRLNRSLSPEEVIETPIIHNTRALIDQCEAEGGARVTSAGNLNRKTVTALITKMDFMEDRFLQIHSKRRSVFNEQDLWLLHLTRIIAGLAGLIRKYKGRFQPTKRGLELIRPERLPELYHHLFLTTFRKFNLGYASYSDHPGIQDTMAYSLNVLANLPNGVWQDADEKLTGILLPAVRDQIVATTDSPYLADFMRSSIMNWVIGPLSWYGLVETEEGDHFRTISFRTTLLFKKFISFHHDV